MLTVIHPAKSRFIVTCRGGVLCLGKLGPAGSGGEMSEKDFAFLPVGTVVHAPQETAPTLPLHAAPQATIKHATKKDTK